LLAHFFRGFPVHLQQSAHGSETQTVWIQGAKPGTAMRLISQTENGNLRDAPDLFRTFHKTSQQLQEGNELEATSESTHRFMQFIYVSRMFGCTRSGH
jgi:hypothetical protein